jgi:hypothetical protein
VNIAGFGHTARVVWVVDTGVPGTGGLRVGTVNLPLPSHLIRVMPAKGGE